MKASLIPNLMRIWAHNHAHQAVRGAYFEISKVFGLDQARQPIEQPRLGIVLAGEKRSARWNTQTTPYDFYDLRQLLTQYNQTFHQSITLQTEALPSCFHPGQAVSLYSDDTYVGAMGMVHPRIAHAMNIAGPVYALEMDLFIETAQKILFQPFSNFPSVHRDLAFVVSEETSNAQLEETLQSLRMPFDVSWDLFDCYRGKGIDKGQKSLGYRFAFSSVKKTLSDKEIDKQIHRIIQTMEKAHNASVRGA